MYQPDFLKPHIIMTILWEICFSQSVAQFFKNFCTLPIAFAAKDPISYTFPVPFGPLSNISTENQPRKPVLSTALATSSIGKYPPSYGIGL